MKVRLKINDDLWLEEDTDKEVDVFKLISRMTEIFKKDKCGKCGSKDIQFVCRKDKQENDWLEIQCRNYTKCGAKLVYSTAKGKEGIIYPKTRWDALSETQKIHRADEKVHADEHNGYLPNGGWFIYKKGNSE